MFIKNSTISPFFQYVMFFLLMAFVTVGIYYLINIGNRGVTKNNRIELNLNKIIKFSLIVIAGVIIVALFRAYPILGASTFALFVSVLIAFLLNPIVSYLEAKGIKRAHGTLLSYLVIVLLIVVMFVSIIPDLISQISLFLSNLPSSIDYTYDYVKETLVRYNIDTKILDNARVQLNEYLIGLSGNILGWATTLFETIQGSLSSLVTIVLIPLITFHFLVSKDRIIHGIFNVIPKKIKHDTFYLYKEINFAMNEFVKSRMLMAVFIGVSTGIMLALFRLPFAFVIGFLTMILDIVPYLGPVLATAPALIFAFIKSPIIFIWVAILSWFLQWVEQNIVGAKLFSVSSGVHELVTLLSIIIGGGIFGVWGMILSVPAVIIAKILFDYVRIKLRGETPEFTKDIEKELLIKMKKEEKTALKRRKAAKKRRK